MVLINGTFIKGTMIFIKAVLSLCDSNLVFALIKLYFAEE